MQMVLEEKDLWKIVTGKKVEPSGEEVTVVDKEKFQKRTRKALAIAYYL